MWLDKYLTVVYQNIQVAFFRAFCLYDGKAGLVWYQLITCVLYLCTCFAVTLYKLLIAIICWLCSFSYNVRLNSLLVWFVKWFTSSDGINTSAWVFNTTLNSLVVILFNKMVIKPKNWLEDLTYAIGCYTFYCKLNKPKKIMNFYIARLYSNNNQYSSIQTRRQLHIAPKSMKLKI